MMRYTKQWLVGVWFAFRMWRAGWVWDRRRKSWSIHLDLSEDLGPRWKQLLKANGAINSEPWMGFPPYAIQLVGAEAKHLPDHDHWQVVYHIRPTDQLMRVPGFLEPEDIYGTFDPREVLPKAL